MSADSSSDHASIGSSGYPAPYAVRRVYDPPGADDGSRVLVDRLWPRGLAKDRAAVDEWLKTVAPSSELRRWMHKDKEARFAEFARRYGAELDGGEAAVALERLRGLCAARRVTLVTAVKDVEHSHVPVLTARLGRTAA
jgi:uncharacterized protein YeaO (DUF488 family)